MPAETTTLTYFWAAALGLIQGVTEFLPVSSSGHLALAEHLGMGAPGNPAFDALLHVATLVVVVAHFGKSVSWYFRHDRVVLWYVLVATAPTGVIGVAAKDCFEALRLSPTMICLGLLVTASALSFAEMARGAAYQLRDLGWFGAFFLGLCQALAVAPGISRSGATISGAVLCGADKEEAFRFSFIMSAPAVLGAACLHAWSLAGTDGWAELGAAVPPGPALVGFVVAAAAGGVSLRLLRRMVVGGKLVWFAAYCCLAAIAGLVYFNMF